MKFKYYLRGIGLGIIFTSIILAVAHSQNKGLTTDSEVVKRAMELGMVMEGTESQDLFQSEDTQEGGSEIQPPVESQTPETSQPVESQASQSEDSQNQEQNSQPEDSEGQEQTSQPEDSQNQEETASQPENSENAEPEYVVITVVPGEVCRQIAEDLYAHELVDDAEAFRKYMQTNGYGNFIQVGNFPIPRGASYEEIAHILTEKD